MKKKIILYVLVVAVVCASYLIYDSTSKTQTEEKSKLSSILQTSKHYSASESEININEDIDINGDGQFNSEDIAYIENLLSDPTPATSIPISSATPTANSSPTATPTATPTPTPTAKPSWILNTSDKTIAVDDDIFAKGTFCGEYIFAEYNSIKDTIAQKFINDLSSTDRAIVNSGCKALYTISQNGSTINVLHVYGLYNNQWQEVLTLNLTKLLAYANYNVDQFRPVLKYGADRYNFYLTQNNCLYQFDDSNDNCLDIPLTFKECFRILENQTMLSYATTPAFIEVNDNNIVRFLIDENECIVRMPTTKSITDISQITALKDKLVFSFSDGSHYITDTILNSKPGIYILEKELEELKNWDIKDMEADYNKANRLLLRLYDNTIYYYDVK